MIFIYRVLINFIFILSPVIIAIRLIKGKESLKRFQEKYSFFSAKRKKGKLIWFHGASVGEILSIIPIVKKFENQKNISQILITSNTLSSSEIIKKFYFKKVNHQFFPLDTNFITKKFLNYWEPSAVFFIESEIWPNMILNIVKKKIPLILINARITLKSFKKWFYFNNLSKKLFSNFNLCLASNKDSHKFLKKLGAKNIINLGNIKFIKNDHKKAIINKNIKNFMKSKKTWCAASTHDGEELIFGQVHKNLKNKFENLLTIIIPRHIERVDEIKRKLDKIGLSTHIESSKEKIPKQTDILIVDAYGKSKSYYNNCDKIFLGGSLVKHGGQNPIEAAIYGCTILHGPYIYNFKEIYSYLKKNKISHTLKNLNSITNCLSVLFQKKTNSKKIKIKLNYLSEKILNDTCSAIEAFVRK